MVTKILVKKSNSEVWANTLTIIDHCTNATLSNTNSTEGQEIFEEIQKILKTTDFYELEQKVKNNIGNTQISNLVFKLDY